MNSKESLNILTSYGVNYIGTKTLEPFLVNNDKDFPLRVKCAPIFLDDLSECKMNDEHILRDNDFIIFIIQQIFIRNQWILMNLPLGNLDMKIQKSMI